MSAVPAKRAPSAAGRGGATRGGAANRGRSPAAAKPKAKASAATPISAANVNANANTNTARRPASSPTNPNPNPNPSPAAAAAASNAAKAPVSVAPSTATASTRMTTPSSSPLSSPPSVTSPSSVISPSSTSSSSSSSSSSSLKRSSSSVRKSDLSTALDPNDAKSKDPFYIVKERVQQLMGKLQIEFEAWQDIIRNESTYQSTRFQACSQHLHHSLSAIKPQLADLHSTVQIVTDHRAKFKGIDDRELTSRRNFVTSMQQAVDEIESTINSRATRAKIDRDQRDALLASSREGVRNKGREGTRRNDTSELKERQDQLRRDQYVRNQAEQQKMLAEAQDAALGDLGPMLDRLMGIAENVGTELEDHSVMVSTLNNEVTTANDNMAVVMKKLDILNNKSENWKRGVIILMGIIIIVLIVLVAYT